MISAYRAAIFVALEIALIATPNIFPTLPPVVGWVLYAIALGILLGVLLRMALGNAGAGHQTLRRWLLSLPMIILLMGTVMAGAGATWLLLSEPASTGIEQEKTKRSFDLATQKKFMHLLEKYLPSKGNAEIRVIDLQYMPFAETLDALFASSGWQTNLNKSPQPHKFRKLQGIGIEAFNKHYLDATVKIFNECGISDTHSDLRPVEIARDNPKWPMVQTKIYVNIGYVRE